jgi:replicative DNA helicase
MKMLEHAIFQTCALETHFSDFDRLTGGLRPSDLIVIAGRPSNGKTSFVTNIAENVALFDQKVVGVFSLEMSREALFRRMMCSQSLVDSHHVQSGFVNKNDYEKLLSALSSLADAPIFIEETSPMSVTEMRAKCRLLRQKYRRLDLIVVDGLQYVHADVGRVYSSGTEAEELSAAIRALKVLAREFECPVLTTCQLEGGRNRPTLADLSKCGSVEQDADVVAFIVCEDLYYPNDPDRHGRDQLIIAKQRNGPTGIVRLAFIKSSSRFVNAANEDPASGSDY